MTRQLDPSKAGLISDTIIGVLQDDGGFTVEEIIPGLLQAVVELSDDDEQILDEAVDFLVAGGVDFEEEVSDDLEEDEDDEDLPTSEVD